MEHLADKPELLVQLFNGILGLIGMIAVKTIGEFFAHLREQRSLKNIEHLLESLPAVAAEVDATKKQVAALEVRVSTLEDLGPVLR